jgi:hypothetical protein
MQDTNATVGQVTATVLDRTGGRSSLTCVLSDFEQTAHGAVLGRLTVPWERLERVSWDLPPREPDADEEEPMARVRVVIDDGTDAGQEIVVPSERFEVIDWAVGMLVDHRADATLGMIERRRILVPWHAVREYERLTSGRLASPSGSDLLPARPDA